MSACLHDSDSIALSLSLSPSLYVNMHIKYDQSGKLVWLYNMKTGSQLRVVLGMKAGKTSKMKIQHRSLMII